MKHEDIEENATVDSFTCLGIITGETKILDNLDIPKTKARTLFNEVFSFIIEEYQEIRIPV